MSKDAAPQVSQLTAKEICSIIKASKDAALYSLEYRDLKIRFWGEVQQIQHPVHVPKAMLERQSAVERDMIEESEIKLREETLEELLIRDPVAYEEHMSSDDVDSEKDSDIADSEQDRHRGAE